LTQYPQHTLIPTTCDDRGRNFLQTVLLSSQTAPTEGRALPTGRQARSGTQGYMYYRYSYFERLSKAITSTLSSWAQHRDPGLDVL